MRTEHEIYIDFSRAKEQAEKLRTIASRMDQIANDELGGTLRSIQSDWTGDNSEKFNEKGVQVQQKINLTAADIRRIADAVEEIAQRMYDTEMAAIQIAAT